MSFDFSTLVTDRTQADVSRVKQIAEKIKNGTASESELAEFNSASMKGAYNHTDLNRVTAAMESLKAKLEGYGYNVPGYQRIKVPHVVPEPAPTNRLPEGYLELAWIESTGTQYIDTGFKPNQDTRVVMDFENLGVPSSYSASVAAIYGTRNGSSSGCYVCWISDTAAYPQYGNVSYNGNGSITVNTKSRLKYEQNKTAFEVNSTTISCPQVSFSANYELLLLCANSAGTVDGRKAVGKLYSCQIYDNGTLVLDCVPCINPDGAVGLYDLVTKAFFGNSGAGSFVAGAIPRELPEGYTQVEYIESTGTQYIDTGFKANQNTTVAVAFQSSAGSANISVVGADSGWANNGFGIYLTALEFGSSSFSFTKSLSDGNKHTVVLDKGSGSVDGSVVWSTSGNFSADYNMYLLSANRSGSSIYPLVGKLYSCKIYDNGAIVRDFVPCKNNAGVLGLYDLANDTFYKNAGSGTFVSGGEVDAIAVVSTSAISATDDTEYDPHTWYEFDWPTPDTMTLYLLNVAAIRSVLAVMNSTPSVPPDVSNFMAQEANDIEKILEDVNLLLIYSSMSWYYCADLFSGEV